MAGKGNQGHMPGTAERTGVAQAAPTMAQAMAELPQCVQEYLRHVQTEKRLAARTHTLYTLDLLKLCEFAQQAGQPLLALQSSHIRRFVAQMHGAGRSARGVALILSGWRSFFRWAAQQQLLTSNPVEGVRGPKAAKPLPKALNVDDAVQLASFRSQASDPWLEARDAAMTELLYSSGLRVGELAGLDCQASTQGLAQGRGWVDLQAAEAHVQGKGSKRRIVPVGQAAVNMLSQWLQLRTRGLKTGALEAAETEPALFIGRRGERLGTQSIWARIRLRAQMAGLATAVHPHVLRHSFASHMLQSSGDLRAVQELLGHASIATTQIYTRLDFQHLAQAYEKAHPRARRKPDSDQDS